MPTKSLANLGPCEMWKREVKLWDNKIATDERLIRALESRLQALQARPHPEPAEIEEIQDLKQKIVNEQAELESDRNNRNQVIEDLVFFCGSSS